MQYDTYLVVGLIIVVLMIPTLVGAWVDGRTPRGSAILTLVGGGLIALALSQKPGGYTLQDIPLAFTRVVAHYTR